MEQTKSTHYCLGLDLGSVSLKVALLYGSEVLYEQWTRVTGDPVAALRDVFPSLCELHAEKQIAGIAITGSGRSLLSGLLRAQEVNEISAHARATSVLYPRIRSIIEIGGQDSKLILFTDDHTVQHFAMNEVCAAGTGAFLDQQAARLKLSIDEFAALALQAASPVRIAGRCAVFAKTDMTHHQQEGCALPDIVAGLNEALVRSYLANLVRGRRISTPVAFQGGAARNPGLVAAFRRLLKWREDELLVPRYHHVMGAIGAALIAADAEGSAPRKLSDLAAGLRRNGRPPVLHSEGRRPRLSAPETAPLPFDASSLGLDGVYLGMDVGSVSVKLVVLSPQGIIYSDYRFSNGRPLDVLREMHTDMRKNLGEISLAGAGVHGQRTPLCRRHGGRGCGGKRDQAQARAAACLLPGANTVIEIGGQDAKFLKLQGRRVTDFAMNRVCAAGTGVFLQERAARLNVAMEDEFSAAVFAAQTPAGAGRAVYGFHGVRPGGPSAARRRPARPGGRTGLQRGGKLPGESSGWAKAGRPHTLSGWSGGEYDSRLRPRRQAFSKIYTTSAVGKVSGAIGAALAAFEARREGRFSTSRFSSPYLFGRRGGFCLRALCERMPHHTASPPSEGKTLRRPMRPVGWER